VPAKGAPAFCCFCCGCGEPFLPLAGAGCTAAGFCVTHQQGWQEVRDGGK
jgi:hypothetical protein